MQPDCNYETHKICVTHSGQTDTNLTDTHFLPVPLKEVVSARLLAANVPWNDTANVVYLTVDELDSQFKDFAAPLGATSASILGNPTTSSIKRKAFCPLYSQFRGATGDKRIMYTDDYPTETEYKYPIQKLEKLTVSVRDENDAVITIGSGLRAYFYFEFVCKRLNICY